MILLKKGQIFEQRTYFICIEEIINDSLSYYFYNKKEFYFSKVKKERFDVECCKILVTVPLEYFLCKIKSKELKKRKDLFGKTPISFLNKKSIKE